MHSHYELLGVPADADTAQLKSAYRRLARVTHPDVAPDSTALFLLLKDAYETLADPAARAAYDARLAGPASTGGERSATGAERPPEADDPPARPRRSPATDEPFWKPSPEENPFHGMPFGFPNPEQEDAAAAPGRAARGVTPALFGAGYLGLALAATPLGASTLGVRPLVAQWPAPWVWPLLAALAWTAARWLAPVAHHRMSWGPVRWWERALAVATLVLVPPLTVGGPAGLVAAPVVTALVGWSLWLWLLRRGGVSRRGG